MNALVPRLNAYIPHRPTPRQAAFLLVPQREVFFGGAAGGGKSDALLMAALQYVDLADYHAVLVRDSFASMEEAGALIDRAKSWLIGTDAVWSASERRFIFPPGSTLSFRPLSQDGDERSFMGAEYSFIGVDEVTNLAEAQYRFLLTRLRRAAGSTIPLRMRAAGMPYGKGIAWVRARFVDEPGERIYIPSLFSDNPYLDTEDYERSLAELDPVTRAQLRYGDWSVIPAGGMFRREWLEKNMADDAALAVGCDLCRYWDLAATEPSSGSDPDFTAGVLLARDSKGVCVVIDVLTVRASALGVETLVKETAQRDGELAVKLGSDLFIRMEQEPGSSGKALVDHYLRQVIPGFAFAGIAPSGSKKVRAAPVASLAEAGHLYVVRGRWNRAFFDELCAFPLGPHDDQVDALSGAFTSLVDVEENSYEERVIIYDAGLDIFFDRDTGDSLSPPWPRRSAGRPPY